MLTKAPLLVLAFLLAACGGSNPAVPSSEIQSAVAGSPAPTTAIAPTTLAPATTLPGTPTATIATVATASSTLAAPRAEPPIIDGVMEAEEWSAAAAVLMSDGATAHFMYRDEILYLGVTGETIGAVNVVIAGDDQVSILHSSAALGSAEYARSGSVWELVHGFDWCCRRGSDPSAREALFDEEGWDANIGYDGDPGVVEYAVAVPWHNAPLAISSIRDDGERGFWPADLPAESQDQLVGVPPQEREYDTQDWGRIAPG